MHRFCGKLDCARHGGRARREHELRMEGMRLAVELIQEHNRMAGNMHPVDEFGDGLLAAVAVINRAANDPLFVPPDYDELSNPIMHGAGGERD